MTRLLELIMMNIPHHYKEKLLQLNPQQTNDFIKKSIQQIEEKKTDKEIDKLKKSLEQK